MTISPLPDLHTLPTGRAIAGTGHRPDKLGGFGNCEAALYAFLRSLLPSLAPRGIISGMALGFDTALAFAARDLGIPYVAAVASPGQERLWPTKAQTRYHELLADAAKVVYVYPADSPLSWPQRLHQRNIWMANKSDFVLALHNGSPGGTANMLRYCDSIQRQTFNLWPQWSALAFSES